MYLYLLIDFAIIIFPLAISFERRRINYFSEIKSVALSTLIVSTVYIIWDVFATSRGHWSFNYDYLVGLSFLGLPLEEILFFITVPYSCLFAYEALAYFLKDAKMPLPDKLLPIIGVAFVLLSMAVFRNEYTFLALLSVGLSIIAVSTLDRHFFSSRLFWAYIAVTFILFFIFNFLLTSLPIVEYSDLATTGIRITTIPIEDFMFNFSMLNLYLAGHLYFARRLKPDQ